MILLQLMLPSPTFQQCIDMAHICREIYNATKAVSWADANGGAFLTNSDNVISDSSPLVAVPLKSLSFILERQNYSAAHKHRPQVKGTITQTWPSCALSITHTHAISSSIHTLFKAGLDNITATANISILVFYFCSLR